MEALFSVTGENDIDDDALGWCGVEEAVISGELRYKGTEDETP